MSRPWVRLSFVIIILAVVFTSGYRLLHSERQRNIEHDAASTYDQLAWTLTVVLADLRSAQQAYVATGQDPDEWHAQVATQLGKLKGGLADLRAMSQSSEVVEIITAADTLVERLKRVGESAWSHTTIGQVLMASDLVFTDGQELTRQVSQHLARARSVEAELRFKRLSELRTDDVVTALSAVTVTVVITFVLLPLPRTPFEASELTTTEHQVDTTAASVPTDAALVSADWEIDSRDPPETEPVPALDALELDLEPTRTREKPVAPADWAVGTDLVKASERSPATTVVPDLATTAQLCTDFGKVSTSDELDNLLSRAGDLLNASGLVVWVCDSSGLALRPAIGHGYAPQTLARLARLACDGENATATAYRTARLQIVPGGEHGQGAVAVPLVSSTANTSRCVGVLSAEVRHGWETSDGVQATAMILAAQLSTVVMADPTQAEHKTQSRPTGNLFGSTRL
jgi:hypothetical protein